MSSQQKMTVGNKAVNTPHLGIPFPSPFDLVDFRSNRSHRTYSDGTQRKAKEPKPTVPRKSKRNPLDFIEHDLIASSVIKPRRTIGFMAGHVLRDLQLATVLQVGGNAGGSEAVGSDLGP